MNRQAIVRWINRTVAPFGVQIVKAGVSMEPIHDPASSYMKDRDLRDALVRQLSGIAKSHLSTRISDIARDELDYASEVEEFLTLYSGRPFRKDIGSSGFHNAFWLFITARALDPELIVESGVWKGHTSWLLGHACPDAEYLGFDIDLNRLEYRNPNARFYEHDWSEFRFDDTGADRERSLVFFDCHVNHARRTIEARERGFRHLVFDDNPPAHVLYAYGLPGFPTARMVWDGLEGVAGDRIEWCWHGKEVSYEIDRQQVVEAREIMNVHEAFPDVGGFSRYGGFSYLTYVSI